VAALRGGLRRHHEADQRLVDAPPSDRWGKARLPRQTMFGIVSRERRVDETAPREYNRRLMRSTSKLSSCFPNTPPFLHDYRPQGCADVTSRRSRHSAPRGLTTYTTSKASVIGLTHAMAVDHGLDNILVNFSARVRCIPAEAIRPGKTAYEAARAQRANARC